jgi:hypothetical protein
MFNQPNLNQLVWRGNGTGAEILSVSDLDLQLPTRLVKTGVFHYVLAGPFATRREAEENAKRIKARFATETLIVTLESG